MTEDAQTLRRLSGTAELRHEGERTPLDTLEGSEAERGVDITRVRAQTGLVTFDPALANTAATDSAITYLDGERGILRYRGYSIEDLAERASFVETAYLLINGELPTPEEYDAFSWALSEHSLLHEDMKRFYDGYPMTAHPMAILSAMVNSLSTFYPEAQDALNPEERERTIVRLLSKLRTIAAFAYKKLHGQPFIYPQNHLSYCGNLLHMMFALPTEEYEVDDELVQVLNQLLILHADHEQNCSTHTVRTVGSAQTNLFASISAGINALWGVRHGGANQAVVEMLEQIHADGGDVQKYINLAKDKHSSFRLMGFGHRVYKNYDPRARIIKDAAYRVFDKLGIHDPLLEIALKLEEAALSDSYFTERKLYPNVDFYSGLIYRAMGIPTNFFTVMFALGRLPGWIAHWKEQIEDPSMRITRPRQLYTGPEGRTFRPLAERG
ncbi:citrate synthase [Thiohalorhabdus denitrificans]|uniref:citrate synthase n=1 Tax=Thiohalorhabdus denitrificans TaxID=381306 RepID=UPI0009EAC16D|nr:citrate synthase [Thiohalorhabdus denitrificans]